MVNSDTTIYAYATRQCNNLYLYYSSLTQTWDKKASKVGDAQHLCEASGTAAFLSSDYLIASFTASSLHDFMNTCDNPNSVSFYFSLSIIFSDYSRATEDKFLQKDT